MGFEVIPAIDVAGGRLASYSPGGPVPASAFEGDPLAAAAAYAAAGARWVHVVDMDLAFGGLARNLDVVHAIAALGVRVQASGGIGTIDQASATLEAGAHRVVLGSAALVDEAVVVEAVASLAERLIIGIEVDDGRIRPRGVNGVDLPLLETLGWLVAGGARVFLVTAVARVGSLDGPDVSVVERVVRANRPVIAAGGIASMHDLASLRAAGAVGAVLGRAALEGDIELEAALGIALG
jgi:phosphoribosylformimino-5-aminoimidazole carboxamide ribonucleotide (ProFAR) isomerase